MASLEYLRTEMLTWANALSAYDSGDFRGALRLFEPISDTSKILINMAFVSERLGERAQSIEHFTKAIELDKYLAIGYFQRGVAYFHGGQYAEAVKDFTDAQTMMRTNSEINYNVLGLDYKLKLPEILFNKWLTLSKMGKTSESTAVLQTLREASPPAELEAMITNAMNNPDDACPPCSAPVGTLYRPSASRMQFLSAAEESMDTMPEAPPALRTAPSMTASSLHTSSSDTSSTFLPSVSSRAGKGHRKQRSSTSSTRAYKRSPLANDVRAIEQVPTRAELTRVIGADMGAPLGTEIHGIPCAGVRITHGVMKGLMAWRFIVRRDPSSPRSFKSSRTTNPAVIVNFILDTGREESYVPPAALVALGYFGDTKPGAEVSLLVQGVKTKCTVAHPDEAGRVGLSFMTAGSLTYYFDAGLVAPVLYDGSGERPANVPRTIRAEDLPAAGGSWSVLARILALLRLGRH